MGLSRSTYYDVPSVPTDDAALVATMIAISDEFEAYGYRRVRSELRHYGMASIPRNSAVSSARTPATQAPQAVRGHDIQPRRSDLPDLARHRILDGPNQVGWRTSPTSRWPSASSYGRTLMPGHAGWSDIRSVAH